MDAMLTIRDLKAAALKLGATVEQDSTGVFQVCAPNGKQWVEGSCINLRVDFQELDGRRGNAKWANDEIRDAIERIAFGLEDLDEENRA